MTTVVLMYTRGTNISDMQFLYIDLVALVPLSILQARTSSYGELTSDRPTSTLFYMPVILSVCLSSLLQIAFQLYFYIDVRK